MSYKTKFIPKNISKYIGDYTKIICRSLWERRFCKYLDSNRNIIRWSSEEVVIPYYSTVDKKTHRYFPDFYVEMMPPYLPAHLGLVYLSGLFESLGGAAVLAPSLRSLAGWALVLLLAAVFPANLHMALNPDLFPDISAVAVYIRLPLQIPLIAWAYWATRPDLCRSIPG